jgi:hypothetical protein
MKHHKPLENAVISWLQEATMHSVQHKSKGCNRPCTRQLLRTGFVMPMRSMVRPSSGSTATKAVSSAGRLLPISLPESFTSKDIFDSYI